MDDRKAITFISSQELELRDRGTILICKFTKQDGKLRVVANVMGTVQAFYFQLTPDGLLGQDGVLLLSRAAHMRAEDANPSMAGERLFSSTGCVACHQPLDSAIAPSCNGLFGTKVELSSGETVIADEAYLRESILQPQLKVVRGFAPSMPVYAQVLTDQEVTRLIEYIKRTKK